MTLAPTIDLEAFRQELEQLSGTKLVLRINQNRSTMLSIRRESTHVWLSLHQIFLMAPRDVIRALASYIGGTRRKVKAVIRHFIEDQTKDLDYSHRVDNTSLTTQGATCDLQELYQEINEQYFGGELNLNITWYGRPRRRQARRATLGLYYDSLRLIKIHRLLDQPAVPQAVIEFVTYHEILHHVYPPYRDEKGRNRIHNQEFKAAEKKFKHYAEASSWISNNESVLFHVR